MQDPTPCLYFVQGLACARSLLDDLGLTNAACSRISSRPCRPHTHFRHSRCCGVCARSSAVREQVATSVATFTIFLKSDPTFLQVRTCRDGGFGTHDPLTLRAIGVMASHASCADSAGQRPFTTPSPCTSCRPVHSVSSGEVRRPCETTPRSVEDIHALGSAVELRSHVDWYRVASADRLLESLGRQLVEVRSLTKTAPESP